MLRKGWRLRRRDRVMSQTLFEPAMRTWIRRGRRVLPVVLKALAAVGVVILVATAAYRFVAPPASTLMVWRLFQGYGVDYRWVTLEDMSPDLPAAVIASEDSRFCSHGGVDWTALGEVFQALTDDPDSAPRGASTISMQTVKNLFLWPSRSYVRKVLEMPLALVADLAWPKRRMIEIYLNVVEWGPGIYGAEAAARHHFGKAASALGPAEAALLAAVLPNPLERSAGRPEALTRRLAARVRARMRTIDGHMGCIG
jgi:monofunctional biosynthetic peptidoglycan transglycosylase